MSAATIVQRRARRAQLVVEARRGLGAARGRLRDVVGLVPGRERADLRPARQEGADRGAVLGPARQHARRAGAAVRAEVLERDVRRHPRGARRRQPRVDLLRLRGRGVPRARSSARPGRSSARRRGSAKADGCWSPIPTCGAAWAGAARISASARVSSAGLMPTEGNVHVTWTTHSPERRSTARATPAAATRPGWTSSARTRARAPSWPATAACGSSAGISSSSRWPSSTAPSRCCSASTSTGRCSRSTRTRCARGACRWSAPAASAASRPRAPAASACPLRQAAAILPQAEGGLVAYAAALLNWHRRHRFCSACGRSRTSSRAA